MYVFKQALSPVGRCQTFEAAADGYGRGEGFSAVVMRQAGTASESPVAIVRGSAVNQDGRSSSLTAPNGPSQQVGGRMGVPGSSPLLDLL